MSDKVVRELCVFPINSPKARNILANCSGFEEKKNVACSCDLFSQQVYKHNHSVLQNCRPYFEIKGAIKRLRLTDAGKETLGLPDIDFVAFPDDEDIWPSANYHYELSDKELADLIPYGLFAQDGPFVLPDFFTHNDYEDMPLQQGVTMFVIYPRDNTETPIIVVDTSCFHDLQIDSTTAPYELGTEAVNFYKEEAASPEAQTVYIDENEFDDMEDDDTEYTENPALDEPESEEKEDEEEDSPEKRLPDIIREQFERVEANVDSKMVERAESVAKPDEYSPEDEYPELEPEYANKQGDEGRDEMSQEMRDVVHENEIYESEQDEFDEDDMDGYDNY